MSDYIKQKFVKGQVLKAQHLNYIEEGIEQLSEEIGSFKENGSGGYYTPSVEQTDKNTMRVSFVASDENMPSIADQHIMLPVGSDGQDGKDGTSVTHSWSGTTLTVTSASGTSSADLKGNAPVRGEDYWTDNDKTEIIDEVTERFPILAEEAEETVYVLENSDIDTTLSAAGKVADAKVVGDKINQLSEEITTFENHTFTKVIVGKTKNLLNWNTISLNKIVSSNGSLTDNNLRWTTDFIPLTPENRSIVSGYSFTDSNGRTTRKVRTWTHMACYDADKNYINGTYSSTAIGTYTATDSNIAYVRLSYNPSQVGTSESDFYLMLEYGTEVIASSSDYVPYNEGTEQYVLLDNCVPDKHRSRPTIYINASEGIDEFYLKMKEAYNTKKCDVYIGKGDYIYTNTFVDAIRAEGKRGVPIGNGCRYYFETGARIYCEYTGANASDVVGYFSPLDSQSIGSDYEIYNLDLVAKNTTYSLHDEANGADNFYRHIYKNCYIELDNSALGDNGNTLSKALGGGLGKHAEIILESCVFKVNNPLGNENAASYHGANDSEYTDAKIVVTNCWFDGNFRTSNMAENTSAPYPRMIYTGNSSSLSANYPSTWDVRAWNNEVRNS